MIDRNDRYYMYTQGTAPIAFFFSHKVVILILVCNNIFLVKIRAMSFKVLKKAFKALLFYLLLPLH